MFPTIVLLHQPLTEGVLSQLQAVVGAFKVRYEYRSINGFAAALGKGQLLALAKLDTVRQIEGDRLVRPLLDQSTFWSGVQKARTDFGVSGNADGLTSYSKDDIVVAVVDTGVNASHIDLDGGKVLAFKDFINDQTTAYDEGGACLYHGTHVSSTAAGEGQASTAFTGVAPGAALVSVKVLGLQTVPGQGQACVGSTSQVNSGIQWVIDNKSTYNIRVMNLSLGEADCLNPVSCGLLSQG